MRCMLVAVVASLVGCATGRDVTISSEASPALRQQLAGKTLECAGKSRQTAGYATAGAVVASIAGTAFGTYVTSVDPNPPAGRAIAQSAIVLSLGVTSLGLSLFALHSNIEAADRDQEAGRALAGAGFAGCTMGDDPREPAPPAPQALPAEAPALPAVVP